MIQLTGSDSTGMQETATTLRYAKIQSVKLVLLQNSYEHCDHDQLGFLAHDK